MYRSIAFVLILSCSQVWAEPQNSAEPQFGGGLGYEVRIQREVNPDFAETKSVPQLFAQMLFTHWGAHVEAGTETQSSNSGGLSVDARSVNVGAWGRYKFLEEKRWRPFASAGVGSYFDRVTSQFGTASNVSRGKRPYVGFGGGISAVFWERMLFETELRGSLVRERKEPTLSALLRIGFLF